MTSDPGMFPQSYRHRFGLLGLFFVALISPSCSGDDAPKVYPVHGTVMFRNKPATKAVVVLRPVAPGTQEAPLSHGEVGPDGTFHIGTYESADGAPVGEYTVTITWPELKPDPGGGETFAGDRLGGRYNDAAKSKWRIQIREGDNALEPFRLQ